MTDFELADLFRLFRPRLVQDLVLAGFPTSVAGSILNWFDPTSSEYLNHVNKWKIALCRGGFYRDDIPQSLIDSRFVTKYTGCDAYYWNVDAYCIDVHRVAMLFYKSHAPARNKTDMAAVKERLSSPPALSLTKGDITRLERWLRPIDQLDITADNAGTYGPGVTSEGFSALEKWERKGFIPPVPPSWYRVSLRDTWRPFGVRDDFRITKIAEVPKTLKSNRVVSSEPAQSMFAQLVVADHLDRQLHRTFKGSVFLHDQTAHNTLLGREDWRSIDLSDASDHVSVDLVSSVLPNLWRILSKVRSTHARFPDGDLVPLRTFAPMGSGVCFPILTLVNLAICRDVCRHTFHVYGDDVIVHKDDYYEVISMQADAGLVVNHEKSCFQGHYRESCGLEILGGHVATPIYIRDTLEQTAYSKLNDLVEKFNEAGWFNCAEVVRDFVAQQHRAVRYNPRYQRREVLVPVVIPALRPVNVDGWAGIRKWFCTRNPMRAERESVAFKESRVRTKLVNRYRDPTDYPHLPL